jgi:hypothetical protein
MTVPIKGKPWLTRDLYVQNRSLLSPEYLDQFRGQWIAWSEDGTRVVAHRPDLDDLISTLHAKLLSPEEHSCEYLWPGPQPDSYFGGLLDCSESDPSAQSETNHE